LLRALSYPDPAARFDTPHLPPKSHFAAGAFDWKTR
jgi:hypothetical protein